MTELEYSKDKVEYSNVFSADNFDSNGYKPVLFLNQDNDDSDSMAQSQCSRSTHYSFPLFNQDENQNQIFQYQMFQPTEMNNSNPEKKQEEFYLSSHQLDNSDQLKQTLTPILNQVQEQSQQHTEEYNNNENNNQLTQINEPQTMEELINIMSSQNQISPQSSEIIVQNNHFQFQEAFNKNTFTNSSDSDIQNKQENLINHTAQQNLIHFPPSNNNTNNNGPNTPLSPSKFGQTEVIENLIAFLVDHYNNVFTCRENKGKKLIAVKGKKKILKCKCSRCQEMNIITDHKFSKLKNLKTFCKLVQSNPRIKQFSKEFFATDGYSYIQNQENYLSQQIQEILYEE